MTKESKMSDSDRIPLMFQAQLPKRGKIHYSRESETVYQWVEQWLKSCPSVPNIVVEENVPLWKRTQTTSTVKMPGFSRQVQTKEYTISWRLVTNSGQDEGFIRPVIGAKGLPFYPGSSMKGAFLRVCPKELQGEYCGEEITENGQTKSKPGILRFHGAYPVDMSWGNKSRLVDIIHSQQKRQIEEDVTTTANPQISLYQATLKFGISSTKHLQPAEWKKIWDIWEEALGIGIGSRVSAGYGQFKKSIENTDKVILSVHLCGQGLTSQLLNGNPEFRPNMFKAALRGHTLRLLAGITDEVTAKKITQELWGGIDNGTVVGKLGINFIPEELNIGKHTYNPTPKKPIYMSTYDLEAGKLDIIYIGNSNKEKTKLKRIVTQIIKFAVLLGGFGKSWRRVDHRLFYPKYFNNHDKPMIGCHWEFTEESEDLYLTCAKLETGNIFRFLEDIRQNLINLLELTNVSYIPTWREAWHPNKVQVWARIGKNSEAVEWFHRAYSNNRTIKRTDLTGKINPTKVGRIWHRMYPRYVMKDGNLQKTNQYVELLTIFPDDSQNTQDFLQFLNNEKKFIKIFPQG
ncbi:MAG: hypothetical protein PUP90_03070 [Nostoc sp. S4]|nr:hypothetical protein [Nostoc sp. S4]